MNRRQFFGTMLGALAAGNLGSMTVPAAARADASLNIYVRLIDLQKAASAELKRWYAAYPEYRGRAEREALDLAPADAVLEHLLRHFRPNVLDEVTERAEVQKLFSRELVIDTMSEADMRRVLRSTVAVAVVKNMLSVEKYPLDAIRQPLFVDFANHYKSLIL